MSIDDRLWDDAGFRPPVMVVLDTGERLPMRLLPTGLRSIAFPKKCTVVAFEQGGQPLDVEFRQIDGHSNVDRGRALLPMNAAAGDTLAVHVH